MEKEYCEYCGDFTNYEATFKIISRVVDGKRITYDRKYARCKKCHNLFLTEEYVDYNVLSYNKAYRKEFDIITVDEIEEIMKKYNIGKKPLSRILNFGDVTIIRYLNWDIPGKTNSNILKSVLNDPNEFKKYLLKNKNQITDVAFKKAYNAVNKITMKDRESKLFATSSYIVNSTPDITPLALQKMLYFINGFSYLFFDNRLFNDEVEAWQYGPVYKDIYNSYSSYRYDYIEGDIDKWYLDILSDDEKKFIDYIIDFFGCYSGDTLMKMTHLTKPWIDSFGVSKDNIISESCIKKYFNDVKVEFSIDKMSDIKKYSQYLFKKSKLKQN